MSPHIGRRPCTASTEKKPGLRTALRSILGALLASAPAAAASAEEPPMVLAKTGYLFAGGKIDASVPGSPMTGHMYVEYFIPKTLTHPYPIVMIHGGSQTGTNFTGTPDGREGWAQYFVRRGHAVYVVDQVARGRSAHFSQSQGKVADGNLGRTEQRFVAPERFNLWPQAKLHTQWPGTGKPGDPSFDAFYATQFPSLVSFQKQQEINRDAAIALFDKIGPAVLMIHSQSGTFIWPIADARPNLVKAVIAVEPNGPPVYETEFKGAPEWFADMGNKKRWGLGEVPITYDPPLKDGEELAVVRQDKPDAARSRSLLAAGRAGAQAAKARQHSDADRGVGGVLPRVLRSLHCELADAGGRAQHHDPARRRGRPWQRPHDDAGEEFGRYRPRDARVAAEGRCSMSKPPLTLQMPSPPDPVPVVLNPETTALLIFDVIDHICARQPKRMEQMVPAISSLLAQARKAGVTIALRDSGGKHVDVVAGGCSCALATSKLKIMPRTDSTTPTSTRR